MQVYVYTVRIQHETSGRSCPCASRMDLMLGGSARRRHRCRASWGSASVCARTAGFIRTVQCFRRLPVQGHDLHEWKDACRTIGNAAYVTLCQSLAIRVKSVMAPLIGTSISYCSNLLTGCRYSILHRRGIHKPRMLWINAICETGWNTKNCNKSCERRYPDDLCRSLKVISPTRNLSNSTRKIEE